MEVDSAKSQLAAVLETVRIHQGLIRDMVQAFSLQALDEAALAAVPRSGLEGENARERKKLRSAWRMSRDPDERRGSVGPANSAPPPPLCNRVGNCKWSSSGSHCHCNQWPQWLLTHGHSRATAIATCEGNVDVDPFNAKSLPVTLGSIVAYLRPRGTASS